ncbi:MAG: DEAD/DEAH box helicase, partial [Desulfobacterales bacterium]
MKISLSHRLCVSEMPEQIKQTVRQSLRFRNPKWEENDRLGRWNRNTPEMLYFYKEKGDTLILPRGYVRQLILLCRKHGISHEIEDQRRMLPEKEFFFAGTLRPFQEKAAQVMLSKEFGTLSAPTGSGKTVIALYMIAQRRQPALVVVHTKELAFQWQERIENFLGISAEECGFIGDGKKRIGEKITVAMIQSLYKCAEEISPHIGYLVVDECHRTPSRTFTEAVSAFDARYMLGLTATPWRRDKLSRLIFWHLGDVHHTIEKSGLVEKGHILEAEIVVRETEFKPYYDPVREYAKMLSELTADDERNRLIVADAAQEAASGSGVCLVLSDRKKHCETLQTLLKFRHG